MCRSWSWIIFRNSSGYFSFKLDPNIDNSLKVSCIYILTERFKIRQRRDDLNKFPHSTFVLKIQILINYFIHFMPLFLRFMVFVFSPYLSYPYPFFHKSNLFSRALCPVSCLSVRTTARWSDGAREIKLLVNTYCRFLYEKSNFSTVFILVLNVCESRSIGGSFHPIFTVKMPHLNDFFLIFCWQSQLAIKKQFWKR